MSVQVSALHPADGHKGCECCACGAAVGLRDRVKIEGVVAASNAVRRAPSDPAMRRAFWEGFAASFFLDLNWREIEDVLTVLDEASKARLRDVRHWRGMDGL